MARNGKRRLLAEMNVVPYIGSRGDPDGRRPLRQSFDRRSAESQ